MSQDKVTIKEASDLLKIEPRTVYRYIDKGMLIKVKEGSKTFVLMAEVKALLEQSQTSVKTNIDNDIDIVKMRRAEYEGLLVRLGQLENDRKVKEQYLLTYKQDAEERHRTLIEQKSKIEEMEKLLYDRREVMEMAGQEINRLRDKVARLENLSWLKRLARVFKK